MHAYIQAFLPIHTYPYLPTYMHLFIRACTHTYIPVQTYLYIHTITSRRDVFSAVYLNASQASHLTVHTLAAYLTQPEGEGVCKMTELKLTPYSMQSLPMDELKTPHLQSVTPNLSRNQTGTHTEPLYTYTYTHIQ